jgi:hypothetical protein
VVARVVRTLRREARGLRLLRIGNEEIMGDMAASWCA